MRQSIAALIGAMGLAVPGWGFNILLSDFKPLMRFKDIAMAQPLRFATPQVAALTQGIRWYSGISYDQG